MDNWHMHALHNAPMHMPRRAAHPHPYPQPYHTHPFVNMPPQQQTASSILEAIRSQAANPAPRGNPQAHTAFNRFRGTNNRGFSIPDDLRSGTFSVGAGDNSFSLDFSFGGASGDAPRGRRARNAPRMHPQREVGRGGLEMHQHFMGDRAMGEDGFRDVNDMLDAVFSGMFSQFQNEGRSDRRGMGGMGQHLSDMLRNFLPDGMEEPQRYEDWLEVIERMGGNVNRGANESEIAELPVEKFDGTLMRRVRALRRQKEGAGPSTGGGEEDDEAEKCAICLGEYENDEMVKTLPCYHVFHSECVDRWLKVNKICPFCKQSIRADDTPGSGGSNSSGSGSDTRRGDASRHSTRYNLHHF